MTGKWLAAVLGVSALLAAGCGDDDADEQVSATSAGGVPSQAPASEEPSATTTSGASSETPTTEATGSTLGGDAPEECTEDEAGGELSFGVRSEPRGFDPVMGGIGSFGGSELAAVFDTLMQYDAEEGEFVPRMAESLEPNEDFTEWTLTLRDGVTFGSGAPVDAAAVQFTIDRHRAEDSLSPARPMASLIESMEIVDDRTVVFVLNSRWGNFPSLLAGAPGMVVDPATFEQLGAEAFAADPQGGGAGPFRLTSWARGEEIVLEARDDYWDGPVCVDTLRFVKIDSDDTRLDALLNGELDATFMRAAAQVAEAREQDVNLYSQTSNGGFLLMINNGARGVARPGSDPRVRQAIAYALDPGPIDERTTGGAGIPSSALVPEASILYSSPIEGLPHDPAQASALLEEVKAETGYDGSLHFLCNNAYVETAIAIEAQLEAVGFTVELDNQMSVQDWLQRMLQTADYDISCHSLLMTDAQPWETLQRRLSGGDSPTAEMGYVSAAMDQALTALKEAVTLAERQEALAGVSAVWNEEVPSAVYGHVEEAVLWSDSVEGLDFTMDTIVLFDEARVSG